MILDRHTPRSNRHAPVGSDALQAKQDGSDTTVVIPAYGESPYLDRVLMALFSQTVLPTHVVVVHSGPFDPSERVSELFPEVTLVHRQDRVWAGEARNIGVSLSVTTLIAFLDADVLPDPHWLQRLLECFKRVPGRFIVGSVGFAADGGYWGLCRWMIEFSSFHPYLPETEISGGGAGNMLVAAADLRQAGGFPPGVQAAEDILLFAKLRGLGLINWFCPEASAGHFNVAGFGHYRRHLRWLGEWSVTARRSGRLPFDFASRWPIASIFLGPARFLLISYRVTRFGKGYRWMWLKLVPGLVLGLTIWNLAFTSAALQAVKVQAPSG